MGEMISETILSADALGGPGAADASLCASRAIALLSDAAGEGMRLASLAIDVTTNTLVERTVSVTVRVDKRASSIVFASAEARAGDDLVFTAQGLFTRAG